MPDEIERKDILNRIEAINQKMTDGFAKLGAEVSIIREQTLKTNGRVTAMEEFKTQQLIRDAVEAERDKNLQKKIEDGDSDRKQVGVTFRNNMYSLLFDLGKMGLVALVVFYLTNRR